jgi:DNA-binding NarL/FixJ family response regulator
MRSVRTILADDHRIYIEGLKAVFSHYPHSNLSFDITGIAYTGKRLLEMLQATKIDLLIMDLNLPGCDGLEVLDTIRKERWPIRVIALTMYDDPKIVKTAFKKGLDGYLLKNRNIDELFEGIATVLKGQTFMGDGISLSLPRSVRGQTGHATLLGKASVADQFVKKHHLTRREREILQLITQALSNKEIATRLFISDQTVSVHRKNIMRKLGVSNTAGLIKMVYDYSLV